MTKRILLPAIVLLALLFPSRSFAQGAGGGGGESVLGLPVIECRIETSADQLFFQGNDYNPNTLTVTVFVKNIGPEDTAIARDVEVRLLADSRFILIGNTNPLRTVAADLNYNQEASVVYQLRVAAERSVDGIDVIGAVTTSSNAYSVSCEKDIWVEHEYFPVFNPLCSAQFTQIVFDDNINDYTPNPFTIKVDVTNIGDGNSDSTWVSYIGSRGVSPFPQDTPEKYLDVLAAGQTISSLFQIVPNRRNNDTTITICFQIRGIGGYQRKYYIDTCCVAVFIPAAKQAEYELVCDILPDSIIYKNHAYVPNPFDYTVSIRNIGTALGKDVRAKLVLPAGIQLGPGEIDEKTVGDLPPNGTASLSWKLSPIPLFVRDTLKICVRVFDIFNNQAICCDSVIVDSVRKAIFDVACACPDTIYADTQAGIYTNSPFDVFFTVCNVGSDYADSVKATIIIQAPNVTPVTGFSAVQRKADVAPIPGKDILDVDSCFTFTWPLQAEAIAVGRIVRLIFRVEALNAEPVECVCEVFVQKLDAPNLDVWCETVPTDSLHFDPRTGGYDPPAIIYRLCATNEGGGIAKNVKATLAIPARMILANGEMLQKPFPMDLGPGDTACIEWLLIPVARKDFGSDAIFIAEVTAENVTERPTASCTVFIPALPNTIALSIPRNSVGYTGQIVLAPIYVDDPTDKDIKSIAIEIDYNMDSLRRRFSEDVISFLDVVITNSLTSSWTVSNQIVNATNDKLNFTLTSPPGVPLSYPAVTTDGFVPPLVWLKFRAEYGRVPNELLYKTSDLLWPPAAEIQSKILINNGSIFPRVTDGYLWVSGDCLRPLTASPDYQIFNRPNPFNPATMIGYTIPQDEHVKIAVYDALGREVEILVDEVRAAGTHSVVFDSKLLPSGIYFYRMETPHFSQMKKMVVAK
ncbi:MAG: T9SS type A sorting domain-containing protein [Bacteroidota bacterium]